VSTPNSRTGSALSPPQIRPPCPLRAARAAIRPGHPRDATPRAFYDDVLWVDLAPPYADYLMHDYGAMNLALGVVTMVAAITMDRLIVRTTLAAYIVFVSRTWSSNRLAAGRRDRCDFPWHCWH
jgi:hypothetical protein